MNHWLFKSEPDAFSIDDLKNRPNQTEHWDGVRNYQARNFLKNEIALGDLAFFYHSSCKIPGIVGIMKIVKAGYPDHTAWDKQSNFYDSKSNKEKPLWYMVDVKFIKKFNKIISLEALKAIPQLKNLIILRKGNRLSISPLTLAEWEAILELAKK